jgi:hypothetical protein
MMGGFCRLPGPETEDGGESVGGRRSVVGIVLGGRWADVMDMWGRIYVGNTGASIIADAVRQRIACQYLQHHVISCQGKRRCSW